jgi:hypothetical protein
MRRTFITGDRLQDTEFVAGKAIGSVSGNPSLQHLCKYIGIYAEIPLKDPLDLRGGEHRLNSDYREVAVKSRCVAENVNIACIINNLCWSGRRDSKPHSRVTTMPFSLLNLTATHCCVRELPEFSSLPFFPNSPTKGRHSARNWYHWYHPSPRVRPELTRRQNRHNRRSAAVI